MKHILVSFLIVSFSESSIGQMVYLNSRFMKEFEKGDSISYLYSEKYKIKDDYKTDSLFVKNKFIYKRDPDSVSYYELLNYKYLIISHFDKSYRLFQPGKEYIKKSGIILVSLKKVKYKYFFNLNKSCISSGIIDFDEQKEVLKIIKLKEKKFTYISPYKKEKIE